MLKPHITIIIIAFTIAACDNLPVRQASNPTASPAAVSRTDPTTAVAPVHSVEKPDPASTMNTRAKTNVAAQRGYDDVWQRIRGQLTLHRHTDNSSVQSKLAWYARHQAYLDRVVERARPYIFYIVEELEKRNLPLELALLPIVESAYHPFAYSGSHASGIWQFIPATGERYGLKQNWWYDGRRDIVAATNAALNYLENLNQEFDGNWLHALAAYNTGERNVARAISRNESAGKKTDFWSLQLPRETRGYVPSLLAVAELLAKPDEHGVQWQAISNEAFFNVVPIGKQIDLATAAKLAGLSMDELYTLNPGFNRWATDPQGPHQLLIPVKKSQEFIATLQALPDSERISWTRHVIKRGDSLGLIAQQYHTSVATLQQSNNLRGNLIREGHSLIIPGSKHPQTHYTLSMDARQYRGLKKSGDSNKHIYIVRGGDTLWNIGRQYGVTVKQLCAWNGLQVNSILRPGRKLNLRQGEEKNVTAQAIPAAYSSTTVQSYTVRKGDSLWLIARRFNTSVRKLLVLNNLNNNKNLQPGQELIIENSENRTSGA